MALHVRYNKHWHHAVGDRSSGGGAQAFIELRELERARQRSKKKQRKFRELYISKSSSPQRCCDEKGMRGLRRGRVPHNKRADHGISQEGRVGRDAGRDIVVRNGGVRVPHE